MDVDSVPPQPSSNFVLVTSTSEQDLSASECARVKSASTTSESSIPKAVAEHGAGGAVVVGNQSLPHSNTTTQLPALGELHGECVFGGN